MNLNLIKNCWYVFKVASYLKLRASRYYNLIKVIYKTKAKNIIEIGTFDGRHAFHMIKVAMLFHKFCEINYYGFDLFEDLTDKDLKNEFSKKPPKMNQVRKYLEKTNANIHLFKGDTKKNITDFCK
ncbi:MAG: hypothetical protein ACTSVV_04705 [Promethearchaeota archaeon]